MPAVLNVTIRIDPEMANFMRSAQYSTPVFILLMRELIEWLRGRRPYAGASPQRNYIQKHFSGRAQLEYGWARHRMPYAAMRILGPMLVQTGALMRSAMRFLKRVGYPTSEIWINQPVYAGIHEHGGIVKRGPVFPVRAKALAWRDKSMSLVVRASAGPATIRIPKRDYFAPSYSGSDERWMARAAEQALAKVVFQGAR